MESGGYSNSESQTVEDEFGVVYSLSPPTTPAGTWAQTVLYSFSGTTDGFGPSAGVVIGSGPNGHPVLYGSTYAGGTTNAGTVFALTPPPTPGGSWTHTILRNFVFGAPSPSGVVIGAGGVLYGTTAYGGAHNGGTVFSLSPPATSDSPWAYNVLYSFGSGSDGIRPDSVGVVIGAGGMLYGTTQLGGTSASGTVFSVTAPATPGCAWTETVLYNFIGGRDGRYPLAGISIGMGGILYGSTGGGIPGFGTVFSLTL